MIDHLWQSTLFAAVIALIVPLFHKQSAALRFWLWFCASAKFLLPFSLLIWLGDFLPALPEPARVLAAKSLVMTPVLIVPAGEALPVTQICWVVWAVGALFLAVRGLARWRNLHAVLLDAPDLRLAAPVPVKQVPSFLEPALVGILRPVIIMPRGIVEHLSPCELRAILAHELSHLYRRDNLLAQIQTLVQLCFWFHPLVWWIGKRLVTERERACDERVLETGNTPETYVKGILKICRFHLQPPLPCTAGVAGGNLQVRVNSILANRDTADADGSRLLLLAMLATATILLPLLAGAPGSAPMNQLVRQVATTVLQAPQLPALPEVLTISPPPTQLQPLQQDIANVISAAIAPAAPVGENAAPPPESPRELAPRQVVPNIAISDALPQLEADRQIVCRRQPRSSATRLLGPRVCMPASDWTKMEILRQGFAPDGQTIVAVDSFEKSRSLNPTVCAGGAVICGVTAAIPLQR